MPADRTIEHDPAALGLESRHASTRFGKLHYITVPERSSDEVMLFLHGFGSNWTIWTPLIKIARHEKLLSNQDILLVDLPSFGKSENKLNHLRSSELGQELLELCQHLGYTKIRVSGHSMGGFLALDMAAHNPKILSVHLVAGSYLRLINIVNHPLKGLVKYPPVTVFYFLQILISRYSWLTALANMAYKNLSARRGRNPLYEFGGKSFLYASRNGIDYSAPEVWGTIKPPVYGVYGSRDRLVSAQDMQELQTILPNASLMAIPGASHSMLVTHPAEVARHLYKTVDSE